MSEESESGSWSSGPGAPGSVPWWWRLEDADGQEMEPADGRQEFPTRADAESWVGECWADLAQQGAAAVTLFEGDRQVYGPMSLSV